MFHSITMLHPQTIIPTILLDLSILSSRKVSVAQLFRSILLDSVQITGLGLSHQEFSFALKKVAYQVSTEFVR